MTHGGWTTAHHKPEKHGQAVKWLKEEHGLGHGFANLIVTLSRREEGAAEVALIAAQYSGKKEHLRPIYDAFEKRLNTIGSDIEFSPKKAYVSLRRNKQFATVGPATNTAVEVGINLKGTAVTERLLKGTGMVTHRVRLSSLDELDDELFGWVRAALCRGLGLSNRRAQYPVWRLPGRSLPRAREGSWESQPANPCRRGRSRRENSSLARPSRR